MFKKLLCLTLSLIIVSLLLAVSFSVSAEQEAEAVSDGAAVVAAGDDGTMALLASLVKKFPDGKYWNHMGSDINAPDSVTNTPCKSHSGCSWTEGACSCNSFDRSIQCMGYAHKIAYELTGASPRFNFTKSTKLDVSKLRVGDVIRFRGDRHSICVTGISGSKISFTDCNWDYHCGIRWGVMDISYITSRSFTYVLHYEGNDRKNTDLEFYNHIEDYEQEEEPQVSSEIWKMGTDNVNIRSTASTDGKKVGTIPAGATFSVTEKKYTDEYLWGYVSYGGLRGWAVLNYSEHVSGAYKKPEITEVPELFASKNITLKWTEVDGADYYLFRLYDADKKVIKQTNIYGAASASVSVNENGKYYAKVYSRSKHASSWVLGGNLVSFNVEAAEEAIKIESIKLSATKATLSPDESLNLEATAEPADHTEELIWKSSAEDIVTVENGKLTATGFGKAVVSCSNADGTVFSECAVTVKPAPVKNITLVTSETTVNSISFTWDKVNGAQGYQVYRYNDEAKAYTKLKSAATESYTDTAVEAGKTYKYLVRGYVKAGGETLKGNNVTAKLATRPAKVTGLKQKSSSTGSVTLQWDESRNTTLYVLYKYNSSTKKYEKIKSLKETSYTLSVPAGESAYYRVYATTKSNGKYLYSSASDKIFTVAGPEKAVVTAVSESKGTVKLSWEKVEKAYYYYVYRYSSSGWKRVAILKSDATSFEEGSLVSGKSYDYKVRTVARKGGVSGYGAYSDEITVKTK